MKLISTEHQQKLSTTTCYITYAVT